MSFQLHPGQKNIHDFVNLFSRRLLSFLPGKNPVLYWHFAVDAFTGQRDHLDLLSNMCRCQKIFSSRMLDLFLWFAVVWKTDVVHQVAYLPCFRSVRRCALNFFNDHGYASPSSR